MNISRARPAENPATKVHAIATKKKELPRLEDFLKKRDYVGAITLVEFMQSAERPIPNTDEWLAYCKFHLGDFNGALKVGVDMGVSNLTGCRGVNPRHHVDIIRIQAQSYDMGAQHPRCNPLRARS